MLGSATEDQGKNVYVCIHTDIYTHTETCHRWPFKAGRLRTVLCCIKSQEQHYLQRFHKPDKSVIISGCSGKGLGRVSRGLQRHFGFANNSLHDLGHHLASAVFIFLICKLQVPHEVTSTKFSRSLILSWFCF